MSDVAKNFNMTADRALVKSIINPALLFMAMLVHDATLAALPKFDSHGYLRAGHGYAEEGKKKVCFQAPGALAKYRLGNECELYAEIGVEALWGELAQQDKTYVKAEIMANYLGRDETTDIELLDYPQAYLEIGHFMPAAPGGSVWLGKRYYRRHDVHINDFYYLSISGSGFGIQDLPLGKGSFAYALVAGEQDKRFEDSKVYQYNHDLRWYDLPLNFPDQDGGKLMLWLDYANTPETTDGNLKYAAGNGLAVAVQHQQNMIFGDGYNKFAVQYGRGLMSRLAPAGDLLVPSGPDADARDKASTLRVVNQILVERPSYSMLVALIWQRRDSGQAGPSEVTWSSIGLRPQYYFSDHINLALELGADHVRDQIADQDGILYKATIAPQLSRAKGFWNRPLLRAYYSYAWWSEEFEGDIGGDIYGEKRSGIALGVQMESWW